MLGILNKVKTISILLIITAIISQFAFAESTSIWTDKNDYEPGEIVLISGEGFQKNSRLIVEITRPDNTIESCDYLSCDSRFLDGPLTSDREGGFLNYQYDLNGIEGQYLVEVADRVNYAQTTFTDTKKIDFTQCANDDNNDDIKDDCFWTTGAINQNNGIYTEGDVVPHRLFHKIADAGTHTIRFRYDFTKSDIYAYDFWSTPDITQSGSDLNPCGQLPGWVTSGDCNTLFTGASSVSIPSDSFDNVSAHEEPASRTILISGVSSPSISIVGHNPSTPCNQDCGTSEVDIDITFTTSSNDTVVALWFGGHLATESWGEGYGASSISGAPFHMQYISLDGDSVGQRDNQIQPGAVIPPTYYMCDYDQQACSLVEGDLEDECSSYADCIHTECNYTTLTCDIINSAGTDECVVDEDCYHYICDYGSLTCEQRPITELGDSCIEDIDCYEQICDYGQQKCEKVEPGTPGDPCTNWYPDCFHDICDYGLLSCVEEPLNIPGDPCTADIDCYHYICDYGSLTCEQRPITELGDSCQFDTDCYHTECDYDLQICKDL
ncbi:MAG: hypothetical protein JSW73_02700, partial [Candidatus Woesearchaeota archaeon]